MQRVWTHREKARALLDAIFELNQCLREIQARGPWPLQWLVVAIGWATTSWEKEIAKVIAEVETKMDQKVVPIERGPII